MPKEAEEETVAPRKPTLKEWLEGGTDSPSTDKELETGKGPFEVVNIYLFVVLFRTKRTLYHNLVRFIILQIKNVKNVRLRANIEQTIITIRICLQSVISNNHVKALCVSNNSMVSYS